MNIRKIDHSALRTNQVFIISLLILSFVLTIPALVAFVATVMLVGTVFPQTGLFKRIYKHILKPAGFIHPDVREDNPEPHRFAQGFGGVVTLIGVILLSANLAIIGWALVWLVVALASLNLFTGFCVGCCLYYQLSKRNVPGFSAQPI